VAADFEIDHGRVAGRTAGKAEGSDIEQQLRRMYGKYAPEKSRRDVDTILARFVGREKELLVKVKAKYGGEETGGKGGEEGQDGESGAAAGTDAGPGAEKPRKGPWQRKNRKQCVSFTIYLAFVTVFSMGSYLKMGGEAVYRFQAQLKDQLVDNEFHEEDSPTTGKTFAG
jgi:hypothetical protein